MTNGERFKTADERVKAFRKFCSGKICKGEGVTSNCILSDKVHNPLLHMCEFAWLDLEYKEELKKCPFCGGEARISSFNTGVATLYIVDCKKCFASTVSKLNEHEAISVWNRRCNNDD